MLKEFGELAMAILFPRDDSPESIYRWRVLISGVVITMAASIGTHIALACGFLPMIFPGFASASDVKSLAQVQTEMRVESLGDAIYALKKDQCVALQTGNIQAAQTQDQRIREKQVSYRVVTGGRQYDVPTCELFVSK